MSGCLGGLSVVVTRPVGQAESLCRLLAAAGARAVPFPTLAIVQARDRLRADAVLARIDRFDVAIFVSVNAVEHGLARLGRDQPLPVGLRLAAVGAATARALADRGHPVSLQPRVGFDSESLLALGALRAPSVAGRRIVIFRGEGGRELLAETLRERGASVEYAEVYRRVRADPDLRTLRRLDDPAAAVAFVVTSMSGLENLFAIAGDRYRRLLTRSRFVVLSQRLAGRLRDLGVAPAPLVAALANDGAIVEALAAWRGRRGCCG